MEEKSWPGRPDQPFKKRILLPQFLQEVFIQFHIIRAAGFLRFCHRFFGRRNGFGFSSQHREAIRFLVNDVISVRALGLVMLGLVMGRSIRAQVAEGKGRL